MSGIAAVSNAFANANNSATVTSSGPNILVGTDNSALTDTASGGIFIDLGSGGSATTGANAQVIDFGSNFTINNQGSGCTDGTHCDGVVVNGSDETVNEDSDSGVTVNGNAATPLTLLAKATSFMHQATPSTRRPAASASPSLETVTRSPARLGTGSPRAAQATLIR